MADNKAETFFPYKHQVGGQFPMISDKAGKVLIYM